MSSETEPERDHTRLHRPLSVLSDVIDHEQAPAQHVTPAELARILAVPVDRLERWRRWKQGPPYLKIGRSVRYNLREVHSWLRRNSRSVTG